MMRVLNVPAKLDDNTSNLQAVAKLIADKLNMVAVRAAQNSKPTDVIIKD